MLLQLLDCSPLLGLWLPGPADLSRAGVCVDWVIFWGPAPSV